MVVTAAWQTNGRFRGIARMCYSRSHGCSLTEGFDRDFWEPGRIGGILRQVDIGFLAKSGVYTGDRNYALQEPSSHPRACDGGLPVSAFYVQVDYFRAGDSGSL